MNKKTENKKAVNRNTMDQKTVNQKTVNQKTRNLNHDGAIIYDTKTYQIIANIKFDTSSALALLVRVIKQRIDKEIDKTQK